MKLIGCFNALPDALLNGGSVSLTANSHLGAEVDRLRLHSFVNALEQLSQTEDVVGGEKVAVLVPRVQRVNLDVARDGVADCDVEREVGTYSHLHTATNNVPRSATLQHIDITASLAYAWQCEHDHPYRSHE